jgi:hypothetical protein
MTWWKKKVKKRKKILHDFTQEKALIVGLFRIFYFSTQPNDLMLKSQIQEGLLWEPSRVHF